MSKAQTVEKTARRQAADKAPRREPPPAAAPNVPDERDVALARLERTLVEERQIAAKLREENDALRFKGDVLEKSYSKQLADARQRNEVLQKELDAHKSRFAELGTGAEDTLRLLADTRAELNRVTADFNMLKAQTGRAGGMPAAAHRQPRQAETDDASSQTINALLSGAPAARGREGGGDSNLHQRVKPEQAAPLEEMLPPDLIFTKDDDDKKSR
jgi:hypothetical protein